MTPVLCKAKKDYIDQEAGEKYETKWFKLLFCFILMNLFLFEKTETGAIIAPWVPKLGYYDGRVPKLSSRVSLATSRAGVVCHKYVHNMETEVKYTSTVQSRFCIEA